MKLDSRDRAPSENRRKWAAVPGGRDYGVGVDRFRRIAMDKIEILRHLESFEQSMRPDGLDVVPADLRYRYDRGQAHHPPPQQAEAIRTPALFAFFEEKLKANANSK